MGIALEVWGDYACFSRPEMKVERVSYDVITPSAARGIIESIYRHPGMVWRIDRIRVANPIKFFSIKRNEMSEALSKQDVRNILTKERNDDLRKSLVIDTDRTREQRNSIILKDVRYVIEAHFEVTDPSVDKEEHENKITGLFWRRVGKGQCYHMPYFGMREFNVFFRKCEEFPVCPAELKGEKDLGWMLYDMDYSDLDDVKPVFFRPVMVDGVIDVPKYEEIMGGMV